ncbi:MAG: hypothetical protein HY329_03020, partial [Chloroflexi bacterium]|nr:hypothetical protein [Chloroflexota bacterium]
MTKDVKFRAAELDRLLSRPRPPAPDAKQNGHAKGETEEIPSDLAPLVAIAHSLEAAASVTPSDSFRFAARRRLMTRISDQPRNVSLVERLGALFGVGLTPALARATAILAIVGATSGGVVFASSDSLPDEPLYGVKLAIENARLHVPGAGSAPETQLRIAERRL